MAKFTLDAGIEFDEIKLVGISCHQKIYKLCWALNKSCGLEFTKAEDYRIEQGEKFNSFLLYEFLDPKTDIQYRLVENGGAMMVPDPKNEGQYKVKGGALLVPELKNIDYLLVIQGKIPADDLKAFVTELKNTTFILTAFTIEVEDLKSKNNFLNFL